MVLCRGAGPWLQSRWLCFPGACITVVFSAPPWKSVSVARSELCFLWFCQPTGDALATHDLRIGLPWLGPSPQPPPLLPPSPSGCRALLGPRPNCQSRPKPACCSWRRMCRRKPGAPCPPGKGAVGGVPYLPSPTQRLTSGSPERWALAGIGPRPPCLPGIPPWDPHL